MNNEGKMTFTAQTLCPHRASFLAMNPMSAQNALRPMNSCKDFIVRIYRFEHDKPRGFVGIVEEVGKKGKKGFNTYDELWEILNPAREAISPPQQIALPERDE